MNLLFASPVFPAAIDQLRESHDVITAFNAPEAELIDVIVDREALVFRSGVTISADVMAAAPNLKLLIRAGSGLDNIDMDYVRERRLPLYRIEQPGARAVAELAFSLMLNLARQVRRADTLLRQGHWAKHEITGYLLEGKTLGIYGAGNIGRLAGRMGVAWGMKAIGCTEHPSPEVAAAFEKEGLELAPADEVLARSDFLSIHLPLTQRTRNIIDSDAIAKMKRGAFLINLARGGIVDELALLAALESGHLAGAGTDVHAAEGEGKISPLAGLDNVLLTPHMGAGTVDSQSQIGERVIEIVTEHAT